MFSIRALLVATVLAVLSTAPFIGTVAPPGPGFLTDEGLPQIDAHRIKFGFKEQIPADIDALAEAFGGAVVLRSDVLKFVAVQLPDDVDAQPILQVWRERPDVEWALYDGFVYAMNTPRSPLSPNPPIDPKWNQQYGPALIGAPAAWTQERGRDGVTIAILDTGVHAVHPDLDAPCIPGCNLSPYDVFGHGTHVAGIAAAETNDVPLIPPQPMAAQGIAGMAQVDLMSIKALTDAGVGWWTQLAVAILGATAAGADVLSMSLGGNCNFGGILLCPEVEQAINIAWSLGVVLVAASGNNGANGQISHPAAFNNMVAVGSVGPTKARSGFSNGGPGLDVMAPGENVISSVPPVSLMCGVRTDPYCSVSGTSMSTPHVSGVAALILSHCPTTTNAQVVSILQSTAEDLGTAGWDSATGFGLVRADSAIAASPTC